mgnify:CR=1 FL=1
MEQILDFLLKEIGEQDWFGSNSSVGLCVSNLRAWNLYLGTLFVTL